jgi:hypothetical protein
MKWPDDAQSSLTGEIVGRLKDVTQNVHKIPDVGISVFADALRIWQRCVHCYYPETGKRELLTRLVQALLDQRRNLAGRPASLLPL